MTGPQLIQKSWSKWMLLFLFWTILGLAFAGQLYLSRSKTGAPVFWTFAMGRALADWYVFALLSVPALWLGRRFPAAGPHWPKALSVHLLTGAVFSLSWMVLRAAYEDWRTRGSEDSFPFSVAFSQALGATFFFNLLVYWGIVAGQNAFTYYWKFHERELHAAALETRLTEARLQALQMQLNPHFLFNTLNAIASLMHKDVDAADRMIVRLSSSLFLFAGARSRFPLITPIKPLASIRLAMRLMVRSRTANSSAASPRLSFPCKNSVTVS